MNSNISQSTEVMLYPRFYREYVIRLSAHFNRLQDKSMLTEFPRGSIIHLLDDNFLMNKPIVFAPTLDNWALSLKPVKKYINHIVKPVEGPIPYSEDYLLPGRGVVSSLLEFKRKTIRYIKPWASLDKMPKDINALPVISYLSLYRARVLGMFKTYRKIKYVLTSVLNNILRLPNVKHFIMIPVGTEQYKKAQFLASFREHSKVTIKAPNDPWYIFMAHLLGFMHGSSASLFSELTEQAIENTNIILYSNTKMIVVNLKNLKEFNHNDADTIMNRFINQLNTLSETGQQIGTDDIGLDPSIDTSKDDSADEIDIDAINSDEPIPDSMLNNETPLIEKPITISKRSERIKPIVNLHQRIDPTTDIISRPELPTVNYDKAYRFSKLSLIAQYTKIIDKYKRFLSDHNLTTLARAEEISKDEFFAELSKVVTELNKKPELIQIPKAVLSKAGVTDMPDIKAEAIEVPDDEPALPVEPIPEIKVKRNVIGTQPKVPVEAVDDINDVLENSTGIIEEVKEDFLKIQPKPVDNNKAIVNAPAYVKTISDNELKKFNESSLDDIDSKSAEVITAHTELTQAQSARATTLAQAYKDIKLGGKKVGDIIASSPDDKVSSNTLDFLATQIPDSSMLKSSVANFDTEYMEKFFFRDLVMELASFNKVGMFLKDLNINDVSDSLNNMYEVKASYEDINHKSHTIRFTLPKVDKRGYCYINGNLKVLKKQRISNPICKVSATRVTLSSDYNKYLVERVTTVAHSFINYIDKIIENSDHHIIGTFGTATLPLQTYPYEYTAISKKYTSLAVRDFENSKNEWYFFFNNPDKLMDYFTSVGFREEIIKEALSNENDVKGYLFGMCNPTKPIYIYMTLTGTIVVMNDDGISQKGNTFVDLLCEICNLSISHLAEWTEFKLLSKSVPTIFALAYKYGLSYMLNYTKCKYAIYDRRSRFPQKQSDVVVKFSDKVLVIPRAPLVHSLLFAGLNNYDLSKVNIEDMDGKDVYYDLLQAKRMSVHNLKGIDNFFDLFVDPITRDVLFRMGEPTEAKDLLIRATALLTTEDYPDVAASTNFRFRSYERMCTAVYKVLANTYGTFRYKGIGTSNTFSIPDYEITNMIVSDQLMEGVEQINPVNDIKYREEYGHSGAGGRQSDETFMVSDRRWPSDGVGIIGESSLDNGKTGYAGSMSNNPTITNIRGQAIVKDTKDIEPSEAFTCTSLLGPCVINDDSKRASFFNIHMSHYVATEEMTLPRVRTGYERVVAHRCKPPFAYAAEADGIIEKVNTDAHVLTVYYPKENKRVAVEFGDMYTNNGGGGFYCTQNIIINGFKQGDKVKRGDVIIYNDRFFFADPFNKQIDLSLGTLANVAVIDIASTLEDSSLISQNLAKKMMFNPVHPRDIVITKQTTIHKYASVGTTVLNTDPLLTYDQSEIDSSMFGGIDDETANLLANINRKTPKAKFTGRIVKLDAFYLGGTEDMSPSAKALVNAINKEKAKQTTAAKGTYNESDYHASANIKQSARIGVTVLDESTLIIRFYIQQDQQMNAGDKLEVDSSLKSVCAGTVPDGWKSEDGSVTCDVLFSAVGINKRLISSPIMTGIANRCLEQIENNVLNMYFG